MIVCSVDRYLTHHFLNTWFQSVEVNMLLEDIIVRMNYNRNFEAHYVELQSICTKLIDSTKNREALLISVSKTKGLFIEMKMFIQTILFQEHFLPLLDLLQKESVRMEICKHTMTVFKNSRSAGEYCRDAVLTNALMYICKILNDTTK